MQLVTSHAARHIALLLVAIAGSAVRGGPADAPKEPPPNTAPELKILSEPGLVQLQDASRTQTPPPSVRSRYGGLLKQIEVPTDRATYGDFYDFGFWQGSAYAGHTDLPAGYWVYLAPNWYIFKEDVSTAPASPPAIPRAWGPEQATGAPDTWPKSGDIGTAWASKTPDGQPEWLELTYAEPMHPAAALVYETYNPGALTRITAIDADGKELELWAGADPTAAGSEKGISVVPLHAATEFKTIRIYIDSQKVPGWNEIDAVGLVNEKGETRWAVSAKASSTYAERGSIPPASPPIFDSLRNR
ncbi:MAG TPA: hypothetical protein VIM11_00410 [Tepidisphaeraceae bacterium]|jgi:hypothetical protein